MSLGLCGVGEDAGGLDDDVDAQLAPGKLVQRAAVCEGLDALIADDDRVVTVERHVVRQTAEDGVVLQQVSERRVVSQVVDCHDLDIGGSERLLRIHRPEEVTSDTAETVYANPDSHNSLL